MSPLHRQTPEWGEATLCNTLTNEQFYALVLQKERLGSHDQPRGLANSHLLHIPTTERKSNYPLPEPSLRDEANRCVCSLTKEFLWPRFFFYFKPHPKASIINWGFLNRSCDNSTKQTMEGHHSSRSCKLHKNQGSGPFCGEFNVKGNNLTERFKFHKLN